MKKILGLAFVALVFTSCQKQKIAYVDNGLVINEIKEKVDLEEKYNQKDEAFKRKVDSFRQVFQVEYQKVATLSKSQQESELQALNQKDYHLVYLLQVPLLYIHRSHLPNRHDTFVQMPRSFRLGHSPIARSAFHPLRH